MSVLNLDTETKQRLVSGLVWLTMIITSMYYVFLATRSASKCQGEARRSEKRSKAPLGRGSRGHEFNGRRRNKWWARSVRPVQIYYLLICIWFLATLIKNVTLYALNLSLFEPYRWLDCFLLGRVHLNGHFAAASSFIGIMFASFVIIRLSIMFLLRPQFDLQTFEFLLTTYDQVLAAETRLEADQSVADQLPSCCRASGFSSTLQDPDWIYQPGRCSVPPTGAPDGSCNKFAFTSPFTSRPVIRPNRTVKSWAKLMRFTLIYLALGAIFISLWTPTLVYMIATNLLTQRGFELYYANCVDYIVENYYHRNHSAGNGHPPVLYEDLFTSQIYWPTKSPGQLAIERKSSPLLLPMVNLISLDGWYHCARSLADILDDLMLWIPVSCGFIIEFWVAHVQIYDLQLYLDRVERMLRQNLHRLRLFDSINRRRLRPQLDRNLNRKRPHLLLASDDHDEDSLRPGNLEVQALLEDLFRVLGRRNRYVSYYTLFCTALWLLFTTIVYVCLFNPRLIPNMMARSEIYSLELFSICFFLSVVGTFAAVRTKMCRIYSLVASNMALDQDIRISKVHWMILLKYFHPAPLYCFSLFGSAEISWLFCFKVSISSDWPANFELRSRLLTISDHLDCRLARQCRPDCVQLAAPGRGELLNRPYAPPGSMQTTGQKDAGLDLSCHVRISVQLPGPLETN